MESRGRGRGVGRGRASGQGAPQQRPGQQPPPPRQETGAPRGAPQGAWARPPQPAAPAWPRPPLVSQPPVQQASFGRGERMEAEKGAISRRVTGDGDNGGNDDGNGRGGSSVRGRVDKNRQILFTRPEGLQSKKGSSGKAVLLSANYLPLLQKGKWCLYQYRVDFNPDIDHTGRRRFMVRQGTQDLFKNVGYLFDGTVLFSPQRIANDQTEVFVQDGEDNIRITIRLVGDLAWGDFHYLQLFNIIIRKCLQLMGLKLVGRNYYMPENQVTLAEHKIQLWPGYFTSMRQHEKDILLNVDLQFKFMRTDNVYDLLLECMGSNARREFQNKIIGSIVLTYYNNKTYRIDDVDFSASPESTFKMRDGSDVSYSDYYRKKYKVNIRVRDQPMLISRSKPREIRAGMPETVYLVPELCQLTGLTQQQRDNFQLMKALATHTRVGAEVRMRKLMEFARRMQSREEVVQEVRRWDLNLGTALVQFQGRILTPEVIFSGGDNQYSAGRDADWTRELRSKPMVHAPKMDRLAVICPSRLKNATQDFIQLLGKTAGGMRWSIGSPKIFDIPDDRSGTYIERIDRVINESSPSMIFVVLTNNSADRYSAIKKKCYIDRGIPSQMFVARNFNSKGVMSIATKVAIQMSCKLGGAPWSVMMPLSGLMVVGYDVCRDTANKKRSFAGMVASMDKQLSRYYSVVSEHTMEEELSDNIATFLMMACQKYQKINGGFPERILVYRDGVGDGQIPYVLNHEVTLIRAKLREKIYNGNDARMAFVVVSKRINTRIFQEKDNPPPGTVVDDVITLPERYDFFLVSQCVKQGTVSPTNYNVISDTMGLSADKMQILTQKFTHLYYNWSGTVRVPAPCQYAHKLAFMVSQNLHRPAHRELEDLLYYL